MVNEIIVLGVIISLIYTEITGFSPAGLIVSGYLVLSLKDPWRIIYTIAIVLLTLVVFKIVAYFTIIYGRRQFALMILISFSINAIITAVGILPISYGIIGVLIPGIIANEFQRQGVLASVLSLSVVMGVIALVMILMSVPLF